jgi:hypothetical protein
MQGNARYWTRRRVGSNRSKNSIEYSVSVIFLGGGDREHCFQVHFIILHYLNPKSTVIFTLSFKLLPQVTEAEEGQRAKGKGREQEQEQA